MCRSIVAPVVVLSVVALQGCSVGSTGLIVGRVFAGESATVVEVFSLGASLRPRAFERGASVGYRSASYVYAKANPGRPSTRWAFFHVALPDAEPMCVATTLIGAGVEDVPYAGGLTLGYKAMIATVGPELGESAIGELRFDRGDPMSTVARLKREPSTKGE